MPSPAGAFTVAVRKEDLVFAAAHFITLPGHRCETLHGHNYRAGVELAGELEPEVWYVYDFVALKLLMRRLVGALDHKVLLPATNPALSVQEVQGALIVAYDGRPRYTFPATDCVVLPIPNTTVEMLSQYMAGQVRSDLRAHRARHIHGLAVEVEENFGQGATYRETLTWD